MNDDAKDKDLARLLSAGYSYAAAGAVLGMSKSAVYRRMQAPSMRAAVGLTRSGEVDRLLVDLRSGAQASIEYLCEVVADERQTDRNRLRAASHLLTHGLRQHVSSEAQEEMAIAIEELEILVLTNFNGASDQ